MLSLKVFMGTLFLGIITASQLFAQKETNNLKSAESTILLFPDFYHTDIKGVDTTWTFEFEDRNTHKISVLNLKNVDDVDHMEYFRSYKLPRPETGNGITPYTGYAYELIYRYVHPDTGIWLRVNPKTNKITHYELHKDQIISTDTMKVIDPATKMPRNVIRRYYKTEIISEDDAQQHHHHQ